MKFWCVGCGRFLFKQHGKMLCYTCPCGATILATCDPMQPQKENLAFQDVAFPASFFTYLAGQCTDLPHIEYYLGTSNAQNPLKTKVKELLISLGSQYQGDCAVCKSRAREYENGEGGGVIIN